MNPPFWKDKKVFVTGHTGFKGSWLCLWLQRMGAEVIGYALSPATNPSHSTLAHIEQGMTSITGDIRDTSKLHRVFAEHRPEIVLHLAAQALVREAYTQPVDTYSVNVMGTVNLFEAVKCAEGVKVVVNVTSDKCYDNREWPWPYRENDALGGKDPYSASKACAELITSSYRESFFPLLEYHRHGVALATARAGNVIGGGDWGKDRLIPDLIDAFRHGEAAHIRYPQAVRPWQHVLEPLRGYLCLAERLWQAGPDYSGAWNFGPKDDAAQPVSRLVERIAYLWGDGAHWKADEGTHPAESQNLRLDCSKANTLLGWTPRLSLDEGLQLTVDWYRAWNEGSDIRTYSLEQIAAYTNEAAE